tara:strand:+ start:151 stop:558 length:408 start_codon:yes stop_codon:yes gene_type:complete
MTSFDKRPRGRNNRRNGRRNYGSRSSQVIKLNDQGRTFNQQRVKFNGNASKLHEKYKKLAAEALSIGDKVLAESYLQHADHFVRMLPVHVETNHSSQTELKDQEDKSLGDENKELEINKSEANDKEDNVAIENNL